MLLLVAAGAGAGGYYGRSWMDQQAFTTPPSSPSAPQEQQRSIVTALGRLEPESEIVDVGVPTGRLARLEVAEGAIVDQGDVLAYLESYDEMLASRDLARSQLDEAQRRLEVEIEFGEASIEKANANLKYAQEVLLLQVQAQEAALRRAQAEFDEAENDRARANKLLADETIPKSQYDDVALLAEQASEQLDHHQKLLEQYHDNQLVKLELAQAELRAAHASKSRQELATQTRSLAEALKLAEARLQKTVIRAPRRGQILKVLTHAGEVVGHLPILKMGNTDSMFVTAEVYETDVRHVRLGQKAVVRGGAFSESITGRVESIGRLVYRNDVFSLDPTVDADARVIEVRVRLDDSEVAARYNHHQVDVEIHLDDPTT